MTAYHGGKQRIGKKLANIIVEESIGIAEEDNFKIKGYCEPFCGMLGVYQHIPSLFQKENLKLIYKAGDTNNSVIKMWQASQKGWKPPNNTTEETYNKLKNKPSSALKGYIGHQYSYGGQFFNGYAPKYGKTPDSTKASKNVQNISSELKNVQFKNVPYTDFSKLKGYVIYCDPPYEGGWSNYNDVKSKTAFNGEEFWEWCDKMAYDNIIFVSSYKAPRGTECIFKSTHRLTGDDRHMKNKQRTEKLYLLY
jgi:site-specific DNA-adenine methylase